MMVGPMCTNIKIAIMAMAVMTMLSNKRIVKTLAIVLVLVHRVLHLTHLGGRHASVCAGGGGAWHDDGSMQCTAMIVTRGDNEQKK